MVRRHSSSGWQRVGIVFLVVALLAGCSVAAPTATPTPTTGQTSSPQEGAPQPGGTVTRAITAEPSSLDPHGPAGAGQSIMLPYIFDTLVYRDVDNTYRPFLAESWDVASDGTAITFTLRQGVTFHDGTPLDADAVAFTFERFKERGNLNPLAGAILAIQRIEVVDDYTVRFHFAAPVANFLSTVAMPYAGILSPTAMQEMGEEAFALHPVGTGPFRFEAWEPGVSITLARNEAYAWGPPGVQNAGPPHIATLVLQVIPDAGTQVAALQAGEVDILFVNQPAHIRTLQADDGIALVETTLNSLIYLGFQTARPPFDEVAVRRALAHAVNKAEILQLVLEGYGEEAFALLPETLPGFDPSLKAYELGYDPEQAKALLAEAGFVQGADGGWTRDGQPLRVTLVSSTRPPNGAIATLLQSQFQAIGVPVEVQLLDSRAVIQAATDGQYDVLLWRYDWDDPEVLNVYLSSDRIGGTNRQFYRNPDVDALLQQGAHEMDAAARAQVYVEAQKLILSDAPWQPLYTPVDYIAIGDRVADVVIGSMGRILLNDAWVAR